MESRGLQEQKLIEGILKRKFFKRLWVVTHDDDERRWREIVRGWDDLKRTQRHKLGAELEMAISKQFIERPQGTTEMAAGTAVETLRQRTAAKQPWLLVDNRLLKRQSVDVCAAAIICVCVADAIPSNYKSGMLNSIQICSLHHMQYATQSKRMEVGVRKSKIGPDQTIQHPNIGSSLLENSSSTLR